MKAALLPIGGAVAATRPAEEIPSLPAGAKAVPSLFCAELSDAMSKRLYPAAAPEGKIRTGCPVEAAALLQMVAVPEPGVNDETDAGLSLALGEAIPREELNDDSSGSEDDLLEDDSPSQEGEGALKSEKNRELQCPSFVPMPFPAVPVVLLVPPVSARQTACAESGAGTADIQDGLLQSNPPGSAVVEPRTAAAFVPIQTPAGSQVEPVAPGWAPSPENAAGQGCANCPPPANLKSTRQASSAILLECLTPEKDPENGLNSLKSAAKPTLCGDLPKADVRVSLTPLQNQMARPVAAGTVVAQGELQMKMPLSTHVGAAPAGNPVVLTIPEDSLLAAASDARRDESLRRLGVEGFAGLSESLAAYPRALKTEATFDVGAPTPASPLQIVPVIFHEVALLRQMKGSSMVVMLKPDAETQLMVRLDYQDGQLEASARCERGDYTALQSHWPDLRRALESQGVRLMDLENAPDAGASHRQGAGDSSRNPGEFSRSNDESDSVSVPSRAQKAVANPQPLPHLAGAYRLLESWA